MESRHANELIDYGGDLDELVAWLAGMGVDAEASAWDSFGGDAGLATVRARRPGV